MSARKELEDRIGEFAEPECVRLLARLSALTYDRLGWVTGSGDDRDGPYWWADGQVFCAEAPGVFVRIDSRAPTRLRAAEIMDEHARGLKEANDG